MLSVGEEEAQCQNRILDVCTVNMIILYEFKMPAHTPITHHTVVWTHAYITGSQQSKARWHFTDTKNTSLNISHASVALVLL